MEAVAEELAQLSMNPTTIFDLPLQDILVTHIGQYLCFMDIVNFGKCSKDSWIAAKEMLRCLKRFDSSKINEEDFNYLKNCRSLKKLMLKDPNWTNEIFKKCVSNNPRLECVFIGGGSKLQPSGLLPLALLENLTNLSLHVPICTDDFLRQLSERNNKLKKITLSCNPAMTNTGLVFFFQHQPHLEEFHIYTYFNFKNNRSRCDKLNSTVVQTIVQHCRELRQLCVFDRRHSVQPEDVQNILRNCPKIEMIVVKDIAFWIKGVISL